MAAADAAAAAAAEAVAAAAAEAEAAEAAAAAAAAAAKKKEAADAAAAAAQAAVVATTALDAAEAIRQQPPGAAEDDDWLLSMDELKQWRGDKPAAEEAAPAEAAYLYLPAPAEPRPPTSCRRRSCRMRPRRALTRCSGAGRRSCRSPIGDDCILSSASKPPPQADRTPGSPLGRRARVGSPSS